MAGNQCQEVRLVSSCQEPSAEQTLDYALSMLGGLAEMAAIVNLDGLAGDLKALAAKHRDKTAASQRSN